VARAGLPTPCAPRCALPASGRSHRRTLVGRQLSGLGIPVDDVALLTEISDETVRKYYRKELGIGRAEANMAVARSLFRAATREHNPNVVAAMFWLENRAGWKALAATDAVPADDDGINCLRIEFVSPRDRPNGMDPPPTVDAVAETATKPRTFEVPWPTDGADTDTNTG
jgi:hypothetical protein